MNASDRRALEMCRRALDKLHADDRRVRTAARANVALWMDRQTCSAWYVERWTALLDHPTDEIRTTLLADTDEGQALRANNPFAGLFDRAERNAILAAGRAS